MEFATFYVGAGLSPYLQACLRSWSDYGHHLDVYTYDPEVALPTGTVRRDANEIIDSSQLYTYRTGLAAGSVAAFANEFRYRLVAQRPVIWVDTDVLCLRADWPDREYHLGWETPGRDRCNNAVFGVPRESAVLAALLERVDTVDRTTLEWGDTGPTLLTRLILDNGWDDLVAPREDYYPIYHDECRLFMDPALRATADERVRDAYAVHLWDEIWKRARIPTFLRPPEGSFMERVLARHEIHIAVRARFDDLDALDYVEPGPTVPQGDYVALADWAHELESSLTEARAQLDQLARNQKRRFGR